MVVNSGWSKSSREFICQVIFCGRAIRSKCVRSAILQTLKAQGEKLCKAAGGNDTNECLVLLECDFAMRSQTYAKSNDILVSFFESENDGTQCLIPL